MSYDILIYFSLSFISIFLGLLYFCYPKKSLTIFFAIGLIIPTSNQMIYFIGASTFGVIAYYSLVISSRIGEMSVISPFRYSRIVFAMLLAIIILGERPDSLTLIGATIVVASGFYTFIRETVLNKPQ